MAKVTDKEAQTTFAFNMQRIMNDRGVSQSQLAKDIGESEARISHYRNDNRMPSIGVATRIAAALGVTIDELLQKVSKRKLEKLQNSA